MPPNYSNSSGNSLGPEFLSSGTIMAIGVAVYVYAAVVLTVLAGKTRTSGGWMAWFPILNLVLMCRLGRKPGWWIILMMIPVVNLIVFAVVWCAIARARNKPAGTGVLVLVPLIGLLVPLYLAIGPATAAGAAGPASPAMPAAPVAGGTRRCGKCGAESATDDAFCGNCGERLPPPLPVAPAPGPAAPASGPTAPASGGSGWLIAVGVVVVLVAAGLMFRGFVKGKNGYTEPNRQLPALPQRMSGTLTVFPVDTNRTAPARPQAVLTQTFPEPGSTGSSPRIDVPKQWFPPGLEPSTISTQTAGITSAVYTAPSAPAGVPQFSPAIPPPGQASAPQFSPAIPPPGQANSPQFYPAVPPPEQATTASPDPVYVHVLSQNPRQPWSAGAIAQGIAQSTGGQQNPLQLRSPSGAFFTGASVQTPQSVTYVVENPGMVVVVYAPTPSAQPIAQRLAQNLGNGQGLIDYPEIRSSISVFPVRPPLGYEVGSIINWSGQQMAQGLNTVQAQSGSAQNDPQVQRVLAQIRQLLPERLLMAEYRSANRRPWNVVVLDFGPDRKAWSLWQLFRWSVGMAKWRNVPVLQTSGRFLRVGDGMILLFQKGPYISIIVAPGDSLETDVIDFGNAFQL